MPRLLDRNRQIPNGFKFYQPETGWKSRPWASFEEIVNSLILHRQANPALTQKHAWATDREAVIKELDYFNALICEKMGWKDYYVSDGGQTAPFPKRAANPLASLLNVAAGSKAIIVDWIGSREEAVPAELSENRASICVVCPMNGTGDWTRFFTVPASEAIRRELEKKRGWNLRTSKDDALMVCTACNCPLPLKVHMPINKISNNLTDEQRENLHVNCWILSESR